ncbi:MULTISPECIES: hypothetical protein [unclassified Leucobacter]|uniref:hypothetical protein n=1 Tax=unclassified Leucobacter TaxID=2621730 RepID=UPI003018CBDC
MVKSWWMSMPAGRRRLVMVVAALLVIISVAASISWVTSFGGDDQARVESEAGKPGQPSSALPGTGAQPGGEESEDAGFEFDVELDENGMALMPVTTDPAEAAAGAAAVAFSVEFSKLTRQEFLDTAIARMTQPSPDYIGPEGQIHTLIESQPFEETQRYYWPPSQVMQQQVAAWAMQDNPERYTWWYLANGGVYDNFTLLPDHYWKAQPKHVVGEAEMAEIDPSVLPMFKDATDMQPDTPGATLTHWWVLSDVENSQVGTASASPLHPAHFAVWCDAPADGGVCGVAYTLDSDFPVTWPRR